MNVPAACQRGVAQYVVFPIGIGLGSGGGGDNQPLCLWRFALTTNCAEQCRQNLHFATADETAVSQHELPLMGPKMTATRRRLPFIRGCPTDAGGYLYRLSLSLTWSLQLRRKHTKPRDSSGAETSFLQFGPQKRGGGMRVRKSPRASGKRNPTSTICRRNIKINFMGVPC